MSGFDIAQVPGQKVPGRGELIKKGQIEASLAVLGNVDMQKGLVTSPSSADGFKLDLANDVGVLDVDLRGFPQILTDCDTPFEGTVIPVGSEVRVFGKFGNGGFRAVVVLVKKQNLTGSLIRIAGPDNGAYNLFLAGYPDPITLPEGAAVSINGIYGSDLNLLQLQKWVGCKPREAEIIASNTVPNQADALLIFKEMLVATVAGTDPVNGIINYLENGLDKTILVLENAPIYRFMEGWSENPDYLDPNTGLEDVQLKDRLIVYGLAACPDEVEGIGPVDFYAYSVHVWPDEADYKWRYYYGNYSDADDEANAD